MNKNVTSQHSKFSIPAWVHRMVKDIFFSSPLEALYKKNKFKNILDVGCLGFRQVKLCQDIGLEDVAHFGVDYCAPEFLPQDFTFISCDLNKDALPFGDDMFDLVVASHIIEHISNPIEFFGECVRVCKPGGLIYFEAPSERSLILPGMPFEHHKFHSLSFFDDPTHLSRPWSPQSLYRLGKYFSCEPILCDYIYSWGIRLLSPLILFVAILTRSARLTSILGYAIGWSSYLILRKPESVKGKPLFIYTTR
jgi:SAM-dependent methyltransferase